MLQISPPSVLLIFVVLYYAGLYLRGGVICPPPCIILAPLTLIFKILFIINTLALKKRHYKLFKHASIASVGCSTPPEPHTILLSASAPPLFSIPQILPPPWQNFCIQPCYELHGQFVVEFVSNILPIRLLADV